MINCEKPQYILNKSIQRVLCYHPTVKLYRGKREDYHVSISDLTEDNYEDYQVLDTVTGEVFNMFVEVPCGHCLLCQKSRQNTIIRRLMYESQVCQGDIFAVTLTYDEENVPKRLTKDTIQRYIKRVRKYMKDNDLYSGRFSWFVASEHGKHRPHYHCIFFGLPHFTGDQLIEIFYNRWNNGYVYIDPITYYDDREVGIGATIMYTTKYCVKEAIQKDEEDTKDIFQMWSQGIGKGFYTKQRKFIIDNPNAKNLQYFDYFTGDFKKVVIDKIFCYYVFDRYKYPKYLDSRKYLEAVNQDYIAPILKNRIEAGRILPQYAPLLKKNTRSPYPVDHVKEIMAVTNIERYTEVQKLRDVFLSNNFEEIDPDVFKDIRNQRLTQIEAWLTSRNETEYL